MDTRLFSHLMQLTTFIYSFEVQVWQIYLHVPNSNYCLNDYAREKYILVLADVSHLVKTLYCHVIEWLWTG
jgi:hypothetical protein